MACGSCADGDRHPPTAGPDPMVSVYIKWLVGRFAEGYRHPLTSGPDPMVSVCMKWLVNLFAASGVQELCKKSRWPSWTPRP